MMKLLSPEEPRAPFAGTFSAANLSLTITAAAATTRQPSQIKLLTLAVISASILMPLLIMNLSSLCYLIHPHPSHILFWDVPFGHFLGRTDRFCMCESHFRPLGLYIFTTSPPLRVASKVMHPHRDSLLVTFSGRKIKSCGQMAGISEPYQYFQGDFLLPGWIFSWVLAFHMLLSGQCHLFVFKCLNPFLMYLMTGRL